MKKIPRNEIFRKVIHMLTSVFPLAYLWFEINPDIMVILFCLLSLISIFIEFMRRFSRSFSKVFNYFFISMLRKNESEGGLTGATWLFLGFAITAFIFEREIAIAALLFLTIGDSIAALVGISYPKIKLGHKTLSGTLAGTFACILVVSLSSQTLMPLIIIIGAISAMSIELLPLRINDNITIPIFSGYIMKLAGTFL